MTKTKIIPVILAGGSGTRLWPLSRAELPKQFANLLGEKTLFQDTLERLKNIDDIAAPIIIGNKNHLALIEKQLAQIKVAAKEIILEPVGRNTAPAIALAAFAAIKNGEDPILLVLPADHAIAELTSFHAAIAAAKECALNNHLVCFGVVPTRPETGYGYIEFGKKLDDVKAYNVARFVEKPNLELAKQYIASEKYYWNSGMFMFRANRYLQELQHHAPDIFSVCKDVHLDLEKFSACRSDSIDYAVMEKTADAVAVPLKAGWSDVGSWVSLWEHGKKDSSNNVIIGDIVSKNVNNSYIHSTSRKVVAVGVKDCIIVEMGDTVLVIHKDYCEDLKKIQGKL